MTSMSTAIPPAASPARGERQGSGGGGSRSGHKKGTDTSNMYNMLLYVYFISYHKIFLYVRFYHSMLYYIGGLPRNLGQIQNVDPPWGSVTYTTGILESRIAGSIFWILPGVWVTVEVSIFTGSRYLIIKY